MLSLELQAAASVATQCAILSAMHSRATVGSWLQIAPDSHQT